MLRTEFSPIVFSRLSSLLKKENEKEDERRQKKKRLKSLTTGLFYKKKLYKRGLK